LPVSRSSTTVSCSFTSPAPPPSSNTIVIEGQSRLLAAPTLQPPTTHPTPQHNTYKGFIVFVRNPP
jgi:hypothetical protein